MAKLNSNVLKVINPYRWNGLWVFDDPKVGLDHEALVCGADTMCDLIMFHMPEGSNPDMFVLMFSHVPFPNHQYEFDWVSGDKDTGNVYLCKQIKQEVWLCPALYCYFKEAPKKLYISAFPVPISSAKYSAEGSRK